MYFFYLARNRVRTYPTRMKNALLEREDCNVIVVNWKPGARGFYPQAAGNIRLVGVQIAVLIRFLITSSSGSSSFADRFYIVGYSLGAHVAGYAGAYLKECGMTLGRITGWHIFHCPTHNRQNNLNNTPFITKIEELLVKK